MATVDRGLSGDNQIGLVLEDLLFQVFARLEKPDQF